MALKRGGRAGRSPFRGDCRTHEGNGRAASKLLAMGRLEMGGVLRRVEGLLRVGRVEAAPRSPQEEAAGFALAACTHRFSHRLRNTADDKLTFAAVLVGAGEMHAATQLVDEVAREVRLQKAALARRVEVIGAQRIGSAPRPGKSPRARWLRRPVGAAAAALRLRRPVGVGAGVLGLLIVIAALVGAAWLTRGQAGGGSAAGSALGGAGGPAAGGVDAPTGRGSPGEGSLDGREAAGPGDGGRGSPVRSASPASSGDAVTSRFPEPARRLATARSPSRPHAFSTGSPSRPRASSTRVREIALDPFDAPAS